MTEPTQHAESVPPPQDPEDVLTKYQLHRDIQSLERRIHALEVAVKPRQTMYTMGHTPSPNEDRCAACGHLTAKEERRLMDGCDRWARRAERAEAELERLRGQFRLALSKADQFDGDAC